MLRWMVVIALAAGTVGLAAQGRNRAVVGNADFGRSAGEWCAEAERWNRTERVACDVREQSLAGVSALDIDTGGNGGIRVRGTSGSTPRIRFRVVGRARTEADADAIVRDVEISTTDGRVRPRASQMRNREGWSVDVEVESPRDLPLTLTTSNGGIAIEDTSGRARFATTNGGVTLANVSGDVRGRTVNGGLTVLLDGQRWEGQGLDVETTNGGVRLILPEAYNAELSVETTNGGLNLDFPVTVQGRLTGFNRRLVTTLGSGGPRLQLRTVNGGVNIGRR